MNYKQGEIKEWQSIDGKKILWMVTQDTSKGIVIHSDSLIQLGTITDLSTMEGELKSFVGSITMNSKAN
jgi:predicted NAD/FAD-dependent oxidoreductase